MTATPTPNAPAFPSGDTVTTVQPTEPTPDVSQVPPADSEPADRRSAGVEALKAWRESGGQVGPRLNPIERLAINPTSLRLAITAKCYDCMGRDADPGFHRRIRECGCATCPLHAVRPYQRAEGDQA